jgi:hypothetical protein
MAMDRGQDFLRAQVNNAVMQHKAFVDALETHERQAEDERFRELCAKHIPSMQQHQRMLEDYQEELGGEGAGGTLKNAVGSVLGKARDLADATRESDFLRLVNDIVMSRQSEDTFKTFRDAGRRLGLTRLADLGEVGERGHDEFNADANRLVQQLFVEHVEEGEGSQRVRSERSENEAMPRNP